MQIAGPIKAHGCQLFIGVERELPYHN
jgi:hypothetical protein